MSARVEDWIVAEDRLRLSITRAFQTEAHLVPEERFLHGPLNPKVEGKFQSRALALLYTEPTISEAERAALLPLGPEVWAEASRLAEAHLEIEPAIPDRDLAVYSPGEVDTEDSVGQGILDQVDQIARLVLEAGSPEMGLPPAAEETTEELFLEPEPGFVPEPKPSSVAAPIENEEIESTLTPVGVEVEPVEWDLAAAMDPSRLTPLPLVTAALEAIGLDEEQFGFLLRYGTFAPEGRKSEIKIAGLGLAEFSQRAAEWFSALGASKFPIQVIDDGSRELTVYLLEGGPS